MIYIGIGSNLGNRRKNIERAKFWIIQKGIKIQESSNYYESLSWPNNKNPKFLILSPLGTMILGEVLGEDNPMGLPKTYLGLEIVYTIFRIYKEFLKMPL